MKGVILAGGRGTRLYPKTKHTNKHLLPVGNVPMIHHGINKLKETGIEDILIITGEDHVASMIRELGYGNAFGIRLSYKVQDQAGGVAHALGLAQDFCSDQPIAVLLGDNIFSDSLCEHAISFLESQAKAMVFLKEVKDPQRYGVASFTVDKISTIEEKPSRPKSNYAVTGIYFYKPEVFSIIPGLQPSARGELEITDVNKAFLQTGLLNYRILRGNWIDAGTHESLAEANRLFSDEMNSENQYQFLAK